MMKLFCFKHVLKWKLKHCGVNARWWVSGGSQEERKILFISILVLSFSYCSWRWQPQPPTQPVQWWHCRLLSQPLSLWMLSAMLVVIIKSARMPFFLTRKYLFISFFFSTVVLKYSAGTGPILQLLPQPHCLSGWLCCSPTQGEQRIRREEPSLSTGDFHAIWDTDLLQFWLTQRTCTDSRDSFILAFPSTEEVFEWAVACVGSDVRQIFPSYFSVHPFQCWVQIYLFIRASEGWKSWLVLVLMPWFTALLIQLDVFLTVWSYIALNISCF